MLDYWSPAIPFRPGSHARIFKTIFVLILPFRHDPFIGMGFKIIIADISALCFVIRVF